MTRTHAATDGTAAGMKRLVPRVKRPIPFPWSAPGAPAMLGLMLRLWKESYTRPQPLARAAAGSTVVHVLVIALWVAATLPGATMAADSIANRVFYIPPPQRPPSVAGVRETVHYVALAPGFGFGAGPATIDASRGIGSAPRSRDAGGEKHDTAATDAPPGNNDVRTDSVFTVLEVDTAVVRSQTSAAPSYPLDLLKQHVEGMVRARYVVDTTGFADTSSFVVLSSTHPQFLAAVREVLPYMRFTPAKIGAQKVRQLVEQGFSFHISADLKANSAKP